MEMNNLLNSLSQELITNRYIYINQQFYENYLDKDIIDFEYYDNSISITEANQRNLPIIVPNIVHLIYLDYTFIKFVDMISIFSIYFNHKPDHIYFHCDNCSFHGKYWETIKQKLDNKNILKIHKIPKHVTIFGKKAGWIQHR